MWSTIRESKVPPRRAMAERPRPKKIPTESADQIKVVNRVRHFYPDTVVFAIPNGGGRTPMEATKLKEEGVMAGVCDLMVLEARGGWFGLFIEMKRREGGRVSDEQREFMEKARERGYKCVVGVGAEDAWAKFERYMEQPLT